MMAQKSKRSLAADTSIRNNYDSLHSALALPGVTSELASKLYARRIITVQTRDAVQLTSGISPSDRAANLLQAIERSIKIDHQRFRQFIRILRDDLTLKPTALRLHRCYRTLISEAGQLENCSSESDTDLTDSEQVNATAEQHPIPPTIASNPSKPSRTPPYSSPGIHTHLTMSESDNTLPVQKPIQNACTSSDFSDNTEHFATNYWSIDKLHNKSLKGDGITLAILDTGIKSDHKALPPTKILAGRNFLPDRKNHDGSCNYNDFTDLDPCGHGTHCAGIAAGLPYDSAYFMDNPACHGRFPGGVAPNSKLIICRVANTNEVSIDAVNEALEWLAERPCAVDVVSLSFGIYIDDEKTERMRRNIDQLIEKKGAIVVAAASNDGNKYHQGNITYPALFGNVFCIGAHTAFGKPTNMSPEGQDIDFLAPGEDILAPFNSPLYTNALRLASGTSCAAPAVAGLICLVIQQARHHAAIVKSKSFYQNYRNIKNILMELSSLGPNHHSTKEGHGALSIFDPANPGFDPVYQAVKKHLQPTT